MLRSVFDTVIGNVPLMVTSFAIRLEYAVQPVVYSGEEAVQKAEEINKEIEQWERPFT